MRELGNARGDGGWSRLCLLLTSAALVTGCTKDEPSAKATRGTEDVVAWSFPSEASPPKVRLLPADTTTPKRRKRGLDTKVEEGRLAAVVEGDDPGFSWDFADPIATPAVRVEVEAAAPGRLQLFWATRRCPIFSEACSATANLMVGKNVVAFLLDPGDPLRSLRLDPPDVRGSRFWFDAVTLSTTTEVDEPWSPRDTVAALEPGPAGLHIVATVPDPGVTVSTPGLEAGHVTAVELVLRGGPGVHPQLFWDGPCGFFAEACSVVVAPVDAGSLTHRAVLKRNGKWTGRIGALRLDPGPDPGDYVLERVALVHDPAD